jgi:nucleoside 2-deoxyribosyltransferase
MKIFLAAPLFSKAEQEYNSQTAKRLRKHGFEVWLAQEASFIQKGIHKEKKAIYEGNILALKTSNALIAVLDGIDVDAGVAFEIGYAKALGKPIIGLKTDYRTFSRTEDVNLMLNLSSIKICTSISEAINVLKSIT